MSKYARLESFLLNDSFFDANERLNIITNTFCSVRPNNQIDIGILPVQQLTGEWYDKRRAIIFFYEDNKWHFINNLSFSAPCKIDYYDVSSLASSLKYLVSNNMNINLNSPHLLYQCDELVKLINEYAGTDIIERNKSNQFVPNRNIFSNEVSEIKMTWSLK